MMRSSIFMMEFQNGIVLKNLGFGAWLHMLGWEQGFDESDLGPGLCT